jgi:FkbM family methyltransferase
MSRPALGKWWLVWIAIAVAYFFIGINLSSGFSGHQIVAGLLAVAIAALLVGVCYRGLAKQITTGERTAMLPQPNALSEIVSQPICGPPQPVSQPLGKPATRVWLDVGAHLGEKTFPAAQSDSGLKVYAFEPNLAVASQTMGLLCNFIMLPMAVAERDGSAEFYVNAFDAASSLLPLNPEGLQKWTGGDQLKVERQDVVPVLRLDTFLNRAGICDVEFLKIDAQGADLAVIRSAGERLRDIRKISLEVQITPVALYLGAAQKKEVLSHMDQAGFRLVATERQSYGQEENLTFERMESPL